MKMVMMSLASYHSAAENIAASLAASGLSAGAHLYCQLFELDNEVTREGQGTDDEFAGLIGGEPGSLRWWHDLHQSFARAGYLSLSKDCIERACFMIETGTNAPEEDLDALAAALFAASRREAGQRRVRADVAAEHYSDKLSRLLQKFGTWSVGGVRSFNDVDKLVKNSRIEEALLAGLSFPRDRDEQLALSICLHRQGEYSAAIEQFFAALDDEETLNWMKGDVGQVALFACGDSFRQLDDHVSAYAAFTLGLEFMESAETGTGADWPDRLKSARDSVRDGAQRLLAPIIKKYWTGSGSHVYRYLWRSGAAPRANTWFQAKQSFLRRHFEPRSLGRQVQQHRIAGNWINPCFDIRNGNDSGAFQTLVERALAKRLPSAPALVRRPAGGERHPIYPDTGRPSEAERSDMQSLFSDAISVTLGYQPGPQARQIVIDLAPGRTLLALGEAIDAHVPRIIAAQLAARGSAVLWLDRPPASRNDAPLPSEHLVVAAGHNAAPDCRAWLKDATSIQKIFANLPGIDPTLHNYPWRRHFNGCVDQLRQALSSDLLWTVIKSDTPIDVNYYVMGLIQEQLNIGATGPTALVGLASLLEHMVALVKALQQSCRLTWTAPLPLVGGGTSDGRTVAYLRLGSRADAEALVTALLAVGSFMQRARQRSPEPTFDVQDDPQDFPMTATRRRRPRARDDAAAAPDPDDPWRRFGVLGPPGKGFASIVLSGEWGGDLKSVMDLLAAEYEDVPCALVVSTSDPVAVLENAMPRNCREIIAGALPKHAVEPFALATGVPLGRVMATALDRSCVLIADRGGQWQRTRVVLWG